MVEYSRCNTESESLSLIIKGTTISGDRFRPSDWAQRLAGSAGKRHHDGRFRFHPKVRVAIIDGISAVIVDEALLQTEPGLYDFIHKFGSDNELQLCK